MNETISAILGALIGALLILGAWFVLFQIAKFFYELGKNWYKKKGKTKNE